nr:mym-type zinc finger [Pandoravirus massiliensis]
MHGEDNDNSNNNGATTSNRGESSAGSEKRKQPPGDAGAKAPRKRGRRSKKEIEEGTLHAHADGGTSADPDHGGAGLSEAEALAARRAHQKTLGLNRLYGDAAEPSAREFMHVGMGHALMRIDDVFYLHPLSERCLIQRGSVPCPDPSRSAVYRNTLDIKASGPCMHCDRECTAGRVPLPRAYDSRTRAYAVWGNFCSFPCAMAYQLDHGAGVYDTPNVLVLIHKMAAEVWGREGLVSPAPPRFCLRKFGGAVDPEDIEAVSERQYHTIVEAPFISWAMMVECKSVDVTARAVKRLVSDGPPPESPHALQHTAAETMASIPPSLGSLGLDAVDANTSADSNGSTNLCTLANDEDDETENEAHDRIARAFKLRGLPPHDPHMEHPGALCRAGGVDGISASAGRRDAQKRAERGISLLSTTRAAPSGMPPYAPPAAAAAAAAADDADPDAMGGSRWERFLRDRAGPSTSPSPSSSSSGPSAPSTTGGEDASAVPLTSSTD